MKPVAYMRDYAKHLREIICKGVNAADYDHPLKGFHIVVDAGNGAGGFYASEFWNHWEQMSPEASF